MTRKASCVFDGEIDTPEQRAKVPPEVWQKAEPMLDKLAQNADHPRAARARLPKAPPADPGKPRPDARRTAAYHLTRILPSAGRM